MDNREIAKKFSLLGKLMDIYGENAFKAKSYSNAAFTLRQLPQNIMDLPEGDLYKIPGIGIAIGKKIIEIRTAGSMRILDELIAKTPAGILELAGIKGIGTKKIHDIWFKLEIEDPAELLYACNENRLVHLPGFGTKTQENIRSAVEFYLQQKGSYLFKQAERAAINIENILREKMNRPTVITGDFRRQSEVISQLEFVVEQSAEVIIDQLSTVSVLTFEERKDAEIIYLSADGLRIHVYACEKNNFVEKLFCTTGTKIFTDAFLARLPTINFSKCANENELFSESGLQFIPPYLREDKAILATAAANQIPEIIEPVDIKGLIHCHSNWSDGTAGIGEMAKGCMSRGLEFMVISDHSKAAFYAQGLTENRVKEQHQEIEMLNKELAPFKIFKSIECDILADGNLDYDDGLLESFDLVIASVHSNLKMPKEKATQRLLKAISNPFTTILGHMTGRLLLSRQGYEVDHELIIDACARHHVAIELNANPRRLDMRWQWISYALNQQVLISINPDAHSVEEIDNIKYGVLAAQKAMVTKKQNLSSFSLAQFEAFLSGMKTK